MQQEENNEDTAVKICFSTASLAGVRSHWEAVVWQDRLYLAVTGDQLVHGSKHAFLSLLECAEDKLKVTSVVACLDKVYQNDKSIIRNFLFLGFQPLDPGNKFHPSNPNIVCFFYLTGRDN